MSITINFGSSSDRKRQGKKTEAKSFLSQSANPSLSDRGGKTPNPSSRLNPSPEVREDRLIILLWEDTYAASRKTPGWLSILESKNTVLWCLAAQEALTMDKCVSEAAFSPLAASSNHSFWLANFSQQSEQVSKRLFALSILYLCSTVATGIKAINLRKKLDKSTKVIMINRE